MPQATPTPAPRRGAPTTAAPTAKLVTKPAPRTTAELAAKASASRDNPAWQDVYQLALQADALGAPEGDPNKSAPVEGQPLGLNELAAKAGALRDSAEWNRAYQRARLAVKLQKA